MSRWSAGVVCGLVVMSILAGCGGVDSSGAPLDVDPAGDAVTGAVTVFAASSLADAFAELEAAFETAHPGTDVRLNLAGSAALREQILDGAPADVFASANERVMGEVVADGAVTETARPFVSNSLVIAVPAGNPGSIGGLADFADDDLLLGLCAAGVPCGDLARQVLSDAGVEPAIDTAEPDVRALLTKIGADELDGGLVYVTDVLAAGDRVEGIDISVGANVSTVYPIAVLSAAPNQTGGEAFVSFVLSSDGQAILADHGFASP